MRSTTPILALLLLATLATAVEAQLFGRRSAGRDLKALEEYYDDLEDYYEDRNPRLAREAERMENYYEDLRKGRNPRPPVLSVPGIRLMVDPRLRREAYPERSVLAPRAGSTPEPQPAQPPANNRWQQWGSQTPTEQPLGEQPPREPTPPGEPTLAPPQPTEAHRPLLEGDNTTGELRFPTPTADDPASQLEESHVALLRDLEGLASHSPTAAGQWRDYLALPSMGQANLSPAEYYTTGDGRQALSELLDRYDQVATNPQYQTISRLATFSRTRSALRSMLASLEQQPTLAGPENAEQTEELPAPPAN